MRSPELYSRGRKQGLEENRVMEEDAGYLGQISAAWVNGKAPGHWLQGEGDGLPPLRVAQD